MAEKIPPKDKFLEIFRKMVEIRSFEDRVNALFLQGIMPGTIHLYQGQEAVAAGVCANLRRDDVVTSTHRPHGHVLAKGVPMKSVMAELFAKSTGCCKGKGGSMHAGDMDYGALPAIAIVGGGIPVATGIALAFKLQQSDRVAACFFGDGATNEGAFHEAVNMGAIWNLPIVYVCENNFYGASTHVTKVMRVKEISERASAYGIPGKTVDGNDAAAVYFAAKEAVENARAKKGPAFLECKTYRRGGHSRRDANLYRNKEEEKLWMARDPLKIAEKKLISAGYTDEAGIKRIYQEVEKELDEAVEYAKSSPDVLPEDTLEGVYA